MLWFNYELKIETGNEKHKTKCRTDSGTFQNKIPIYFFFLKRGKRLTSLH